MTTFGQQLRIYRRHSRDPQRGGLLTQERLGELVGHATGDMGYSGAAISDWERDKSKIHADDRRVLVALLTVLVECGGIDDISDANDLLTVGNYRRLNGGESAVVFPGQIVDETARDEHRRQVPHAEHAGRNRAQRVLLQKVEHFWVDGVLRKSMAGPPVLALSKCMVDDAVDHPWQESLGLALIQEECPAGEDIMRLFARSEHALLILGAPGSGKTMTLITLAGELLETAKKDTRAAMPVILDLAGWAKERLDLESWIVEELTAKYQIPRRYSRRWLADDELILLLDGFDVLPALARAPCIKAINRFRETNGLSGLVICSRSQEYRQSGLKLRLNRAVRIEALDEEQIDNYLSGADQQDLRGLMQSEPSMRQMAGSPLMLNVLAATDELPNGTDYDAIFDAYTRRMFRRRPTNTPYEPQRTLKYLHWLAGRLEEHSQSIFMIEGIQPSWLPSKRWRWAYMLLSGVLLGLAGGLVMWLLWRLLRYTLPQLPAPVSQVIASLFNLRPDSVELLTIMLGNVALGLLVGIILGLFFEARWRKPVDAGRIEGQRWRQVWVVGLVCGAVATLFVSLFTGWLLSLAWGVAEGFMYMAAARFIYGWSYESDVRTVERLGWSWQRALTGSGVGLILTIIAELLESQLYPYNGFHRTLTTLLLAGFILGGLTGSSTAEKSRPNQGVWMSLRNAGTAAVFTALPLALLTAVLHDWQYALLTAALTALIASALFGVGVFIKHFLLRGLLRIQYSLPWRYSRFLDHASQLVFLRKVGGGYIFMHRLLQQYFAEH